MSSETKSSKLSINDKIPGHKSREQLLVLAKLMRMLKPGSVIVEIGSCAGRGTWTISKNAPELSKVYAIDHWNGEFSLTGKGFELDPSVPLTKSYFLEFIQQCDNVVPVQGMAQDIAVDSKVDALIIDCDNGYNRNNHLSIWERWRERLASPALVVGANYFESRPDEMQFADFIKEELGNLETEHALWWSWKE